MKHNKLGPIVMGSCRALNLLLGLAAAPALLPHTGLFALLPLAYISGITLLSRGEVHGGNQTAATAEEGDPTDAPALRRRPVVK